MALFRHGVSILLSITLVTSSDLSRERLNAYCERNGAHVLKIKGLPVGYVAMATILNSFELAFPDGYNLYKCMGNIIIAQVTENIA